MNNANTHYDRNRDLDAEAGIDVHDDDRANRDPITGKPGSHPVGTGLGAASAGTAGAVVGAAVAGPAGAVAGAAVGAAVGGAVGHNAAEAVNPTYVELEPQLRESFPSRPYAQGAQYEDYQDAYAFGAAEGERVGQPWSDEYEPELRERWSSYPSRGHHIDWDAARPAIKDAWEMSARSTRTSDPERPG